MADYFDINNQACRNMLGEAVHEQYPLVGSSGGANAVKVARMAANAEAEVISYFTKDRRDDPPYSVDSKRTYSLANPQSEDGTVVGERTVMLRYYKVDADDIDTTNVNQNAFLIAMRRTVAFIVTHRIETDPKGERRGLKRVRIGRHEEEYFGSSTGPSRLPTGWDQWLAPYNLKPPVFSL